MDGHRGPGLGHHARLTGETFHPLRASEKQFICPIPLQNGPPCQMMCAQKHTSVCFFDLRKNILMYVFTWHMLAGLSILLRGFMGQKLTWNRLKWLLLLAVCRPYLHHMMHTWKQTKPKSIPGSHPIPGSFPTQPCFPPNQQTNPHTHQVLRLVRKSLRSAAAVGVAEGGADADC